MADAYLLENGTDRLLLEDGSGVYLLDFREWTASQRNTFEGGTNTGNITVANSNAASGPAISASSVTNGWQYATSAAKVGSLGARRTLDTTGAYLEWAEPSPDGRGGGGRWFYMAGNVTAYPVLMQLRGLSDELCASLLVTTLRKFRLAQGDSAHLTASDSPVATVGNWYWVELYTTPGTGTTDGRIEMRILEADGVTVFHTYDTGFAVNAKTVPPANFRMGGMTTTAAGAAWTYDLMDGIAYGSLSSGWIGPGAAPEAFPQVKAARGGVMVEVTVKAARGGVLVDGTMISA